MKKLYIALASAFVLFTTAAQAQVSIDNVSTADQKAEFENDMKTQAVDAEYFSEAAYRAERLAIRKERNTIDFSANLHGSLTAYSKSWQASGDNAITVLANINFLHTYKKNKFSITSTATAKFGYNNMKTDLGAEHGGTRGVWFKNVDEIVLSTYSFNGKTLHL